MSEQFDKTKNLDGTALSEKNSSLDLEELEVSTPFKESLKFQVKSSESSTNSEFLDITGDDVNAILIPDDEKLPASTLRMWVLAFCLSAVIAGVDSFFSMRFPTVSIGAVVAQVIAYPLGNLWYYIVPLINFPLPFGLGFNLNPGRFNQKEHACVFFFSNLVVSAGLVNNLVVEQFKFFDRNIGIGRMILFNLSCYLVSFGWSGLALDILVTPSDRVWPGVLSNIALFKTLHSNENPPVRQWKMTRYKFFVIIFIGSFLWYWLPDLLMPFLSTIGAWISWCKPSSAALSQVFGVQTGLGLFPLTFDWSQITSLNNPLTTPFWSVCCIFGSFVFWIWIVMPGLYYQNYWETAHLPIMTNSIYDSKGESYDATKVIDKNWKLDYKKFKQYSPVILPIAFLMNLALGLGAFAAMMVQFILRFKSEVLIPLKNRNSHLDSHNKEMYKYKRLHWGIYIFVALIGLSLGFAFCEGFEDKQIGAGGFFVSMLIGCCLYIPLALIESRANMNVSLAPFFEIVSAFWYKGQPLTLLYFYCSGFSTLQHAMHTAQGAKVGHYMKVPPKVTMTVLFFAAIWSSLVSPAVAGYVVTHIDDVCTPEAANNMTCRKTKTQFNTHLVWGLFGDKLFSHGGRYSWVLYFFLVGGLVSLIHFILTKFRPNGIWKRFNPILFFGGAANIPSVTGFNFSTWFVVAAIFNFYIHRRFVDWWRKYNLVMGIGLDCGLAIAAIIIYFCVVYTGASRKIDWWGTTVGGEGCDSMGCPHLTGPITPPSEW
ncbi:MAG: small oligopeptide transporter, OPT family [Tetragenococcus koreensis]|nr:small oligopeptide transporter, OPT family [Tetragenococcus koreensis]